jgi:HlyD family secretion protein
MKKIVILGIIVVIGVVAFFLLRGKDGKSEPKFTTAEVQKGSISIMVTATGTLEAVTTVQVGSQVSGTIAALYVDFNGIVKKGQVVAQLDPTFLDAQVAQAQADLDREKASTELSRREYERSLKLFEEQMISESERDITLTNYELAKTREQSAEAALDRVKTNLEYATIVSPIDGVVISRNVDVGQTVAASLQAPTLFTIAQDLTQMQVKASIDEADIGRIKEGQDALFTVDAYPERSFKGSVRQIRLSPQVVQNVVSYDVIITVSNPDMVLKPGMTANVTVLIDQRQDVLKVPSAALRFRPASDKKDVSSNQMGARAGTETAGPMSRAGGGGMPPHGSSPDGKAAAPHGGSSEGSPIPSGPPEGGTRKKGPTVVWILDAAGTPQPVPVETGLSDGSFTEIVTANLKEGDSVIVGQRGAGTPTSNNEQVNPFAPRFPGGQRGSGTRRSG